MKAKATEGVQALLASMASLAPPEPAARSMAARAAWTRSMSSSKGTVA
jgi:hypothetical protein